MEGARTGLGWGVAERRGLDGFAVGGAVRVGLGSGCTAFAAGLGGWIGAGTSALRTGLPGLGGETCRCARGGLGSRCFFGAAWKISM